MVLPIMADSFSRKHSVARVDSITAFRITSRWAGGGFDRSNYAPNTGRLQVSR
jgi:hypothetical protein